MHYIKNTPHTLVDSQPMGVIPKKAKEIKYIKEVTRLRKGEGKCKNF